MNGGADCTTSAPTVPSTSSLPPRRQPIQIPAEMPMAKLKNMPAAISSMVFQNR